MSLPKISHLIWKHFEGLKASRITCKVCDKTYPNYIRFAKRHLIRAHRIYEDEDLLKWEKDTYSLWDHFSKKKPFEARCNHCGQYFKNAFRQDIESHLIYCHEEEVAEIRKKLTDTWLSRHFKFEDCKATCNLQGCKYSVRIFHGIDILKSHLAERHNINEYSGCEERTGDNNADGIIQQFVYEENYASPSSNHDNQHPQSIRNQEDDQMIQHSVDEENYAGSGFYRDNTHWPPLGYPEGYRMIQNSADVGNYLGPSSYRDNIYWPPAFGYPEGYRMIQNSADVGNYPGPSSYRDNIYWPPAFGYPENYRMIQHSVDVGNHASPSSYYNNSHLRSLGNEGGQQSGQQGSRSPVKFWRPW